MALPTGEDGKEPLHFSCSLLAENKIPEQKPGLAAARHPGAEEEGSPSPSPATPAPNALILQLFIHALRDQSVF